MIAGVGEAIPPTKITRTSSLVCARVSAQQTSRRRAPYRFKSAVARLGPVYRWARRLKALARYLRRRPHDPDFAAFGVLEGEGLFLDIGASIGQSALSFRVFDRDSPILSLEPLPGHRDDLRFVQRILDGHEFMLVGASDHSRRATLFVPTIGRYQLPAQSALNREDAAAVLDTLAAEGAKRRNLSLTEIEVDLRRVDELDLSPAFVKIDVEGAELFVLEGLRETIARSRPAMMIERSESIDAVVELLAGQGYEAKVFDPESRRFSAYTGQDAVNVFFLPAG